MQRCSHCNAQQMDGAIFCAECGATMMPIGHRRETTAALNKAAHEGQLVEEIAANVVRRRQLRQLRRSAWW